MGRRGKIIGTIALIIALPLGAFGLRHILQPETFAEAAACVSTGVNRCDTSLMVALSRDPGARAVPVAPGASAPAPGLPACRAPYLPAFRSGDHNASQNRWRCNAP
jgi:hypothetical protein